MFIERQSRGRNDSIVIRKSIAAKYHGGFRSAPMLSNVMKKTHLAIRSGFCRISGNVEFTAGGARRLRSEDELVLLICLTKRFRFFVNTANIGGFWYTRRQRKEGEDSVRWVLLGVDITQEYMPLSMTQRRKGYKKYCSALSLSWKISGFSSTFTKMLDIRIIKILKIRETSIFSTCEIYEIKSVMFQQSNFISNL